MATTRSSRLRIATVVAIALQLPLQASGQDELSLFNSLDSLLNIPVSTASKFAQTGREAAASVTVITAEEIRSHGYRTVADALETVPGFYLTDNRSYQSVGVRGFSPLSGTNNRILLLIDGHSMNDNFLDGFRVGTGIDVDLALLDRIEVVRGPGSALYGSNAMLAVVNLITKTGRAIDGVEVRSELGSQGRRRASVILGRQFDSGLDVALSGAWDDADGAELYFPEWDMPFTNQGVATDADWHEGKGASATASYGGVRLAGHFSERAKGTPTAPFGSDFGNPDSRNTDRRFFTELAVERDVAPGRRLSLRTYYDGADWAVRYPFAATGDVDGETSGRWVGAEGRFVWDPTPAYRLTTGLEVRRNTRARIDGADPVLGNPNGNFKSTVTSGYAQGALQLRSDLHLTLGMRLDRYSTVGAAWSPRGGLVYQVGSGTTLKALYGEAFRAPNQAEANIDVPPYLSRNPDIAPERIRTAELVWEQRIGRSVYTTMSLYDYGMTDLISIVPDATTGVIRFANTGEGSARGVEVSVDANPVEYLGVRAAYAFQRADRGGVTQIQNSPGHSFRLALRTTAVPYAELGVRATYDSDRQGRPGSADTDGYVLTHATIATRDLEPVRVSLVARNLFDVSYDHPAGAEFLQAAHPQDGRALTLRVDLSF